MTAIHKQHKSGGTSVNPARGWRVERIIGRPPHRTQAGRIALPLWLSRDGRHVTDADLAMTSQEAQELRDYLDQLLGPGTESADAA